MRHYHYANTTAQQQPRRAMDRQQQQSSGSGDYQPRGYLPEMPEMPRMTRMTERSGRPSIQQQQQGDVLPRRGLMLVAGGASGQAG